MPRGQQGGTERAGECRRRRLRSCSAEPGRVPALLGWADWAAGGRQPAAAAGQAGGRQQCGWQWQPTGAHSQNDRSFASPSSHPARSAPRCSAQCRHAVMRPQGGPPAAQRRHLVPLQALLMLSESRWHTSMGALLVLAPLPTAGCPDRRQLPPCMRAEQPIFTPDCCILHLAAWLPVDTAGQGGREAWRGTGSSSTAST